MHLRLKIPPSGTYSGFLFRCLYFPGKPLNPALYRIRFVLSLSLFRAKGFLMFFVMKSSDCCCRPGSCVINFHIPTDFNWVFAAEESVVFFKLPFKDE